MTFHVAMIINVQLVHFVQDLDSYLSTEKNGNTVWTSDFEGRKKTGLCDYFINVDMVDS